MISIVTKLMKLYLSQYIYNCGPFSSQPATNKAMPKGLDCQKRMRSASNGIKKYFIFITIIASPPSALSPKRKAKSQMLWVTLSTLIFSS